MAITLICAREGIEFQVRCDSVDEAVEAMKRLPLSGATVTKSADKSDRPSKPASKRKSGKSPGRGGLISWARAEWYAAKIGKSRDETRKLLGDLKKNDLEAFAKIDKQWKEETGGEENESEPDPKPQAKRKGKSRD